MTFDKFGEYMLAKDALNKLLDSVTYGTNVELTSDECRALLSQNVIDMDKNLGMVM